jgi:hypothetical protein
LLIAEASPAASRIAAAQAIESRDFMGISRRAAPRIETGVVWRWNAPAR